MALADIVLSVRRMVGDEPFRDTIATAPTGTTGTSITVGTPTAWRIGEVMEFSLDGEQAKITAGTTNPFTIARGWNETTAGTHTTAEYVLKTPRFGTVQIQEAINDVLDDETWPDVWQLKTTTITPSVSTLLYNLPTDFEYAVALTQIGTGSPADVRYIPMRETRSVPTGTLASGRGLRVPGWPHTTTDATLTYVARISASSIPSTYESVAALGAVCRLLLSESAAKVDREDEVDRPFRILRETEKFEEKYEKAKSDYRARLLGDTGPLRRYIPARRARYTG